jgi:hypothetical protein
VSQVAQSYFGCASSTRAADAERLRASFRRRRLFNRRYRGGVATKLDPLRASGARAAAALVPQTEQAIVTGERISVLLGRSAQSTPRAGAQATALRPDPGGVPRSSWTTART